LNDIKNALDKAKERNAIAHSPSEAALSKAFKRKGPEVRNGIQVCLQMPKKVLSTHQ
jgi:hypothetical protein